MKKETLEKATELKHNIDQLDGMIKALGVGEETNDAFFGTIGAFADMPQEFRIEVKEACAKYKNKLEKELEEL